MGTGPSLWGVGLASTGIILVWSGINDPSGGPVQVFRDLLSGKQPVPGVQKKTSTSPGDTGTWIEGGNGSDVIAEAKKFLGAPYRFGGTTMAGIDCSGLIMVAFKNARGITLPHDATSQTRRGTKLSSLDLVQGGDLIAWGTPARYPHIALAVDQNNCIGAWTYSVPCSIKPIRISAVPGYGMPTAFRITEAPATKKGIVA